MIDIHNIIWTLDSYKQVHPDMYPDGTQYVASYGEARSGGMYNFVVPFGYQYIFKEWLVGEVVTTKKIDEAAPRLKEHFKHCGDIWSREKWDYIVREHKGRLPLRIDTVPEGLKVPESNLLIRVVNTDPKCFWLTNASETLLQQSWYPMVVATRSFVICNIIRRYFQETVDAETQWLVDFILHDFGQRATTCMEQAGIGGMAHLLNSKGTDTDMAIPYAENFYNADYHDLCHSVPASEHSIATSKGEEGEFEVTLDLIKKYPNGILSVVSDSYDIQRAVKTYCTTLKKAILGRNGKFVVRPDSPRWKGDSPEAQVLWIVEELGKGFGFTVNKKGFKVLDSHVGVIYGDSLTENDIENILALLKKNSWSAENCVYGCGGYLLQKLNRDTQRMAFKSCAQCRNGIWYDIFKNPSDITKASKKGLLKLIKEENDYKTVNLDIEGEDIVINKFLDGDLTFEEDFAKIRKLLRS